MFFESVTSLETLENYLSKNNSQCLSTFQFICHLISFSKIIDRESLTKNWFLKEAEFYEQPLELSIKRFIAKRMFAFARKNLLSLMEERISFFPNTSFEPPVSIILKILSFEKIPRSAFILKQNASSSDNDCPQSKELSFISESTTDKSLPNDSPVVSLERNVIKTDIDYNYSNKQERVSLESLQKMQSQQMAVHLEVFANLNIEEIACKNKDFVKEIDNIKYPHLSKVIQKYINISKDKQEKYAWMRLKHAVLGHENLLKKTETTLLFINGGNQKIDILKKISYLTNNKNLNKKLYVYFENILQEELTQHLYQFKRAIESCYDRDDLFAFLSKYPIVQDQNLKKYKLDFIQHIKTICSHSTNSENFEKCANKYLDPQDASIKKAIYVSLFESPVINKIWDAMQQAQSIHDFFSCLRQLKKIPETNKVATILFQLAVTFLRGRQKISFADLQISLNFIPDSLRNHATRIITRKLQQDMNRKINKTLTQNISVEKKWKKLLNLLQNKQFSGAKIKIFHYQVDELLGKLQKISASEGDIEKIVVHELGDNISCTLKNLIIMKHSGEMERKDKTNKNFYRELEQLLNNQEKVLSLRRPLIDLLRSYGNNNFASTGSLSGYELANAISMYYSNPARATIVLPLNMDANIANLIEESINEERMRQLSKLKMY